jgi:hypothetical protein
MKCNKDISFLVIVIRKMHFKKENQMWFKFGWVNRTWEFYGTRVLFYFVFSVHHGNYFFSSKTIRFDRIRILLFLDKSL